ncbi:MAG: hypothetical protein ACOX3M_05205 [Saccharofermentanales bacterium]
MEVCVFENESAIWAGQLESFQNGESPASADRKDAPLRDKDIRLIEPMPRLAEFLGIAIEHQMK